MIYYNPIYAFIALTWASVKEANLAENVDHLVAVLYELNKDDGTNIEPYSPNTVVYVDIGVELNTFVLPNGLTCEPSKYSDFNLQQPQNAEE